MVDDVSLRVAVDPDLPIIRSLLVESEVDGLSIRISLPCEVQLVLVEVLEVPAHRVVNSDNVLQKYTESYMK